MFWSKRLHVLLSAAVKAESAEVVITKEMEEQEKLAMEEGERKEKAMMEQVWGHRERAMMEQVSRLSHSRAERYFKDRLRHIGPTELVTSASLRHD